LRDFKLLLGSILLFLIVLRGGGNKKHQRLMMIKKIVKPYSKVGDWLHKQIKLINCNHKWLTSKQMPAWKFYRYFANVALIMWVERIKISIMNNNGKRYVPVFASRGRPRCLIRSRLRGRRSSSISPKVQQKIDKLIDDKIK